jgi:ABC-2 type transport system permease protein
MTNKEKYSFKQSVKDLLRIWSLEMKIILRDHGVFLFCLIVPIFYPLLYSYIYTTELTREVPVTVIDNSRSSLSREFIRRLDASQWVSVVGLSRDVADARQQIKEQRIYGFLEIPSDFSDNIVTGRQAFIGFFGDMSGMLYYKGILVGATEVSLEMNKHIKIERAAVSTDAEASLAAYPVKNEEVALFNPQQGFATFLIPAVLMLVIQQTLLLGIGMADGTAAETGGEYSELVATSRRNRRTSHIIMGRSLAYFFVYILTTAFTVCVIPRLFNLIQIARPLDLVLFLCPYVLACILFAQALSVLSRNREMSILIFVCTSVPLLFISGISWPGAAVPPFWQGVSWLFPSTFGINGFVRLSVMGATLNEITREWWALWILCCAYFTMAYVACRVMIRNQKIEEERR